jgi:hypothetical protein
MKQQKQLIALAVLLIVAAGIWYIQNRGPATAPNGALVVQNVKLLAIDNPGIHWDVLQRARATEYHGGRNIFSASAPPPPQPAVTQAEARRMVGPPQPPPPQPVAWPANMQFFGYGTVPNGTARRGFFRDGEEVYIFAEGDTVLGRYRIIKINNSNLEFEELSTGRRGTTPLLEENTSTTQLNPS